MPELKTKAKTPAANASASEPQKYHKEFTLPSGKECKIIKFKGKHIQQAKRLMDPSKGGTDMDECTAVALVEIDGKKIVIEDFAEMDGQDYLAIIGPVNELFL